MSVNRTVIEAELKPIAGSLFQPTGFPDLGAAEFETGQDGRALLVESAQSMANRLEGTTWDEAAAGPAVDLEALPYVRVVSPDGAFLSSSRLEAHRLASAYIMEGQIDGLRGEDWMLGQLGLVPGHPLDYRAVARACFRLDPVSLIHGVFFARKGTKDHPWPWQPRIARAVTSFIEATGIRPAVSGGVKRDVVNLEVVSQGDTAKGYGSVPHHRVEYSADSITAYFTIDHAQFRSYGLSEAATQLLEALALYEISTLLEGGLRLRTRCDLVIKEVRGLGQVSAAEAASQARAHAVACGGELGPVTTAIWSRGK